MNRVASLRFQLPEITSMLPSKSTLSLLVKPPMVEGITMVLRLSAALCGAIFFMAWVPAAEAQSGVASVYGYSSGKTASGERASPKGLTAAHRTLPFGTRVRVVNKRNGKTVVVRINDRGPFIKGRVIDVTPAAASALGFSGLTRVTLEQVSD
jgi:rare lipoprotein A